MDTPQRYRKKPVEVEATQWFKNGDHPRDGVGETVFDELVLETFLRLEGAVVRFYRHPDVDGQARHCDLPGSRRKKCTAVMHDHGWIDTMEGGHTVCPGDWIITGVQGERYPIEPGIFAISYEPVTS